MSLLSYETATDQLPSMNPLAIAIFRLLLLIGPANTSISNNVQPTYSTQKAKLCDEIHSQKSVIITAEQLNDSIYLA